MSLRYFSCSDFSKFAGFCQRVWGAGWWDLQSRREEQSASNGWLFKWPKGDQASKKHFCPNCFHTKCLSRFILNRFIKWTCSKNSRIPPRGVNEIVFMYLMKFMLSRKLFTNSLNLFIYFDQMVIRYRRRCSIFVWHVKSWRESNYRHIPCFIYLTRWPRRFHDIFCCVLFFSIFLIFKILNFPCCSNLK